ncbi:hypothetical protein QJQ45_003829 [Haematococcus lacustris]|nr:hypothetical protein QJQ45_003829 [Haematococcus lacustris]
MAGVTQCKAQQAQQQAQPSLPGSPSYRSAHLLQSAMKGKKRKGADGPKQPNPKQPKPKREDKPDDLGWVGPVSPQGRARKARLKEAANSRIQFVKCYLKGFIRWVASSASGSSAAASGSSSAPHLNWVPGHLYWIRSRTGSSSGTLVLESNVSNDGVVVFFGNAAIGTRGGWGAKAVLQACRKVVERLNSGKPTDRVPGKVVTVDEFRTSRVSAILNSPQPCEEELDRSKPTRLEGWKPKPGQVQDRLLRSAWSKRFEAPVRGLMWCPWLAQATPGKLGKWVDRDCNAALNLQRAGESRWRPLELCRWQHRGRLPAQGKEYPALGFKQLRERAPKAKAQQPGTSIRSAPRLQPPRAFSTAQPDTVTEADMEQSQLDEVRAHEVRLMMAEAMNATVLSYRVPEYKTSVGNYLAIVGSIEEVGSWSAHAGARMKWSPGNSWACDVILPESYQGTFEYKVVLLNDKGMCVWEPGPNRKLHVPGPGAGPDKRSIETLLYWGVREPVLTVDEDEDINVELAVQRTAEAADLLPGRNAASVMLLAQQQMADNKAKHRRQVTELREQLVSLQQSASRELERVQSRMREIEGVMEKMQARLDKEQSVHAGQIALLQAKIKADDFPARIARRAATRSKAEAEAVEAAEASSQGQGAMIDVAAMAAYFPHIMAVLPHYSGLSVQRLHAMLSKVDQQPRYHGNEQALAQYLHQLVAENKLTVDNGIFRFKSRTGTPPSARRGSPRPARPPSPPRAAAAAAAPPAPQAQGATTAPALRTASPRAVRTASPTPARASARSGTAGGAELQPKVVQVLSSYAGLTLERLLGMVRASASECTPHQLTAVMRQLESNGLVTQERGVYRYRPSSAPAQTPSGTRGRPQPASALAHSLSTTPPRSPRSSTPPATRSPRTPLFSRPAAASSMEEDDRNSAAPQGSVAGGPPGQVSVAGGPPPGYSPAAGPKGSLMPAADSTGAHPTLSSVQEAAQPVLQALLAAGGPCSLERLHNILHKSKALSVSKVELAAILKNLVDQHQVQQAGPNYTYMHI